ncbi:MAG: acetylxylan esterase [Ruminococcus sp.]|nr:acetylxylan esterase [Candidatus Copronaster equi]
MKKILSILTACLMIISTVAFSAGAKAYRKIIEKNGVMQMGDFDNLSDGYIIYFPTDLKNSDKVYPVAVWANGTMCAPVLYSDLLIGVAKAGYIVVASPDMMPKDGKSQRAEIDYILEENANASSIFYKKVDIERIGAFGHSQGGASCVNAAAADSRIKAIVSIAGASTKEEAEGLKVPSLFLTGKNDYVVLSSMWVEPSYNACNAPAVYASLVNGIHTSCILNAETYINYTVKWFNAWLFDDSDKSAFQKSGELSQDKKWTDFKAKNFESSDNKSCISKFLNMIIDFFKNFGL